MHVARLVFIAFAGCVLASLPSLAAGQDAPPKLSIAAGGGVATPFHGDFDFTAPSWEVSMRGSIAKHVVVEGFFEQWQRLEKSVFLDEAIHDAAGVLVRVGRIEERTRYRMRTAGFNVLGTGGTSRVSFFGGGGVGLLVYDRQFTTTITECGAGAESLCRAFERTFSSNSFTVQGVGEVDVQVAPRVQVFGRYLLVVPVRDPGFGHGTVMGGARVVLW